jgi:hypothetical protein
MENLIEKSTYILLENELNKVKNELNKITIENQELKEKLKKYTRPERCIKYYEEHKEELLEKAKIYNEENKEKIKAQKIIYNKLYYQKRKEKIKNEKDEL